MRMIVNDQFEEVGTAIARPVMSAVRLSSRSAYLRAHAIATKCDGSSLLALDEYTLDGVLASQWVDVTSWTFGQLRDWLGY